MGFTYTLVGEGERRGPVGSSPIEQKGRTEFFFLRGREEPDVLHFEINRPEEENYSLPKEGKCWSNFSVSHIAGSKKRGGFAAVQRKKGLSRRINLGEKGGVF